ncbi:trypsin, alkaline A-like [Vanessa cardui]|uniref:trypsin, alkaline A-like n=1 Tax=Vanessa cardui TaxID=171605 RepID=UPI001F13A3C8|nr:trypsin, alkaline A-like [Vanessa cardui]
MALIWLLSLALVGAASADYLQRYPSIVQVETIQPWAFWEQTCAASILNSRYVLSAASCFSASPSSHRIRAGARYLHTGGVINYVDRVINYPRDNFTAQFHDISVVRLASVITYSHLIQRAAIPAPQTVIPNGLVLAQGGWGRGNSSHALSVSSIRTVSSSNCGINLPTNQTNVNSTSNILCGTYTQWYNVSNADGGSPWFFGNVTVGVVSGLNYGNSSWSNIVATPIAYFTNWIVRTAV